MSAQVSHDEIRHMVRELLRDAVAGGGAEAAPPEETPAAPARSAEIGGLSERVRAALASGGGGGGSHIHGTSTNGQVFFDCQFTFAGPPAVIVNYEQHSSAAGGSGGGGLQAQAGRRMVVDGRIDVGGGEWDAAPLVVHAGEVACPVVLGPALPVEDIEIAIAVHVGCWHLDVRALADRQIDRRGDACVEKGSVSPP